MKRTTCHSEFISESLTTNERCGNKFSMTQDKKAFTLFELLVSITIITILSSIGIISYTSYLSNARDTQRTSDMAKIVLAMKTYKQQRGAYPTPQDSFNIYYQSESNVLAKQGKLGTGVVISSLDKLPLDPKLRIPYIYSITTNGREYQIGMTLENGNVPEALVDGDYKSVSKNILPTLIVASTSAINVQGNNTKFIFNGGVDNLLYTFEGNNLPQNDATSFHLPPGYYQNSDFRSCTEIQEAGKTLSGITQYQIYTGGVLEDTTCP